jgi:hypothetical protein
MYVISVEKKGDSLIEALGGVVGKIEGELVI